ncbi:hypothetical protein N7461_001048 [Penicillium sp. DV-2018c]|nr:hypothetical protein N7461_001048 [Penicillium sp. DV-2018c]
MPRRKTQTTPSYKARRRRATGPSSAGLGHGQASLDQWLDSGDAAHSSAPITKAQRIIQEAQDKGEKEQHAAIIEAIEGIFTFPPWDGQREALQHLVFLRKYLILIAKTSFGKSLILQAVSLLVKKAIAIVVLPLNQIGVEQAECIANLGGKPCFLNADTMTDKLLEEVKEGKYTHVLLSPELAVSEKFRTVVTHPRFRERLSFVAVDEAHLVAHWGRGFRKDYARMHQLRALVGNNVPWLACSATLDQATLETVKHWCAFLPEVKVQRTSINRPELALRLGKIPKNKYREFSALRFLFKEGETVVFIDTKDEASTALTGCREWLEQNDKHKYTRQQTKSTIRLFHRNTSEYDKEFIIAEFRRFALDSSIRVIFATEALGIGVNLPDIRRVIQYGIPRGYHPAVPWQRGGRASRDGEDGEFILLVDEWAFGSRDEAAAQEYARQLEGQRPKQNTSAKVVATERNEDPAEENPETKQRAPSDKERRERLPKFCILTRDERVRLAQYAHQIWTREDLLDRLGGSWYWEDRFTQELFEVLRKAHRTHESSSQTPAERLDRQIPNPGKEDARLG